MARIGQRGPNYSPESERHGHTQAFSSEPTKQFGAWGLVTTGVGLLRGHLLHRGLASHGHGVVEPGPTQVATASLPHSHQPLTVAPNTEITAQVKASKGPPVLEGEQVWDWLDSPPSKPSAPWTPAKCVLQREAPETQTWSSLVWNRSYLLSPLLGVGNGAWGL